MELFELGDNSIISQSLMPSNPGNDRARIARSSGFSGPTSIPSLQSGIATHIGRGAHPPRPSTVEAAHYNASRFVSSPIRTAHAVTSDVLSLAQPSSEASHENGHQVAIQSRIAVDPAISSSNLPRHLGLPHTALPMTRQSEEGLDNSAPPRTPRPGRGGKEQCDRCRRLRYGKRVPSRQPNSN